jgi:hypothetical protein
VGSCEDKDKKEDIQTAALPATGAHEAVDNNADIPCGLSPLNADVPQATSPDDAQLTTSALSEAPNSNLLIDPNSHVPATSSKPKTSNSESPINNNLNTLARADNDSTSNPISLFAFDVIGMPDFLTMAILKHLHETSASPVWQNLITTFFAFEKEGPVTGVLVSLYYLLCVCIHTDDICIALQNLPRESRPEEVAKWIKRHVKKKHEPVTISEPIKFGEQICAWWAALQPTWRVLVNGSYSRDVPAEELWSHLQKGGSAGIYSVVMALSWWIRAAGNESTAQDCLWSTIDDVYWVLLQQLANLKPSRKRSRSEDVNQGNEKK